MFLAWVRFGILISNIILSNQLSPPAITTSTKCAIENQKIQGFTPSQFFQCVRKENKLYFETRYCPSVKNTFYETQQRCLPNIGGGEVRCLIPGKRCSHNKLGPMAYPNKFKPNYYIVCLPKATHICRCYGNAIYDASTQMCRIISTTTDMGRDDSNGIIPKIICEISGIHSTVELENPDKQKCVLFCYQKDTNDQFKLNIICAPKPNLVDANVPTINPIDIDGITNSEENLPSEIRDLIAQELLKSTNTFDYLGWPLEKSTTENSQDEEKRKRTDITSIPTRETFLGSSSTEDPTITWATDQNIKERPFDPFSLKYDEITSEKIVLTSLPTEDGTWLSDISHTLNDKATSTQLSKFSSTEGEPKIQTTEKVTGQDGSVQWTSDKILIPSLKEDETTIQGRETSLASSTIQDDTTQSITNKIFIKSHANTPLSTTDYGDVQSITDKNFTQNTSISLLLITEDGSTQSTIDNNFNERTSSPLILVTEEETTITSVSYTTEDTNTEWTISQNTLETPFSSQLTTTEDKIKSSSEKTSSASSISEDGNTQWTTEQNFKKSSANTLSTLMEDKKTNQSSENLLLASVTPEGGSMQSTEYQTFTETSRPTFSTQNDNPKEINSDNIVPEEEITDPSKTIITSVTYTTEDKDTKWTTNQNTIETSSRSQFLTTENIINTSNDKTSLASLTPENEDTQWTTDQNLKKSTVNTLSTSENLLSSSVTPEEGSLQSTTYQNFKETSSILFSATDNGLRETNPGIKLSITEEETTNPSKTIFTIESSTTEDSSTKWSINQDTIETSSSSQFLTIEDKISSFGDKTTLISLIPEDGETLWIDQDFKKSTANTLSPIMENEAINQSSENLLLASATPDSLQSTTYQTSRTPFSTTEETTNPSKIITPLVSDTTDDKNTKWTTNQNTIETSSSTQLLTTENIIKSSSEKTSLATLIPEDEETQWTTDQNFKKITANETTNQSSENLLLASVTPDSLQSTAYQDFIETIRIPFSTTDGPKETKSKTEEETTNPSKTIITSVSDTTDGKISKWTTNQNTIETSSSTQFLTTENIINTSSDKTSLASLRPENEETQWTTDVNFKKSTANTLSSIMDDEITNQSSENLLLASVTPDSLQSTAYQDFIETTRTLSSTTDGPKETKSKTEEETTNPSKTIITSVSDTTDGKISKWTTNQNTIETSSSTQFLITENIINTSSDKTTSLASLTPKDEETQWTTDVNFKKSTANTLSSIMDEEITNQFSENLLLASVTPERESMQSTAHPTFTETSRSPFLTTDDDLKTINPGTNLLITEEETANSSNTIITTEDINTKWTTNQNTTETLSTPQFLTTDQTSLASVTSKDGETQWIIDQHFKGSTANTLSPILEDETTNESSENLLLANVTPEEGSTKSTAYQSFIETSKTPFSTTDNGPKQTSSDTISIVTEKETRNPSKTIITSVTYTTEDMGTKWTTNQNTMETSSRSQLLTTENVINPSSDKISSTSLTPEDGDTQWTTDLNIQKSTANTLSTIMENVTTNQFSENILFSSVTPEEGSIQSTKYENFKETSSIPSSTIEEETTNPSQTMFTTVSDTTDGRNTKWTTNQNIIETTSSTQLLTIEDKITSSSKTQWPIDVDFKKSTANTLFPLLENEATTQFSENLLFASVTPEGESVSTQYQYFKESTSNTQFSTAVDADLKETSSDTIIFLTTKDIIPDQSNENLLSSSVTPEEGSPQSITYQNSEETSGTKLSTTVDSNLKETNSGVPLQITEDEITNHSNVDLLLVSVTPEGESIQSTIYRNFKETSTTPFSTTVDSSLKTTNSGTILPITDSELKNESNEGESIQSTTYQDFKETSATPYSTTVASNLEETNSGNLLLITDDELTNPSNENLLLASVTPEVESIQSTPYQYFKESTSNVQLLTTVNADLKETISGTRLLTTEDVTTNEYSEKLLLQSTTPDGESTQSTIYGNFKETSATPFSTTVDSGLKATNSGTTLPITDDEIKNESNENLLLASVTPEGESIQSTTYQGFKETSGTPYSTTVASNLEETNSANLLLTTDDELINLSNENLLLASVTPKVESIQSSPYHNFIESTSNSQFSTTENRKVDFKQTTSITMSPITEDETIKSSSENNLLVSRITEDGSVKSTLNENSKQTTSSTRFTITDETITPASEIIAVESISTENGNINSTESRDIPTEKLNSFASPSTTEHMLTTEFLSPNNWTERPGKEVTSRTDLLPSITTQLRDKTTQEELNTTPTSELLTTETESKISTLNETSSATYDDSTILNYTPSKSVQVTLNLEKNLQSTISESTSTPTILLSSNSQSQEIETDINTLPSSSTEFTSTFASITSSISTKEFSNLLLNDSENLKTNIPKENLQSTASSPYSTSDSTVLSTTVTAFSKNDEENLSSTTSLNGYSQSISTTEDTAKPLDLSTTSENLFTTEIDTRLPVKSSTASDHYEYQSILPVSDITNSVKELLPTEGISESTSENSQLSSLSLEPFQSKEYSTETSSTGYSSTTQTTAFIALADSDKDDYSTEAFTTIENVKSNLNVEEIDSDQNINGSPQSSVELEISTIAIKPNWDVTDGTSTSETFDSSTYLEEPEYDPPSQGTYFGMAERCVCTGKRRYRNSCKKHYHCSKIGSLNRFIQSEIMECAYCLQFNAKKRICDFPENVPECAMDDGSFNRICTAEGNYSIPLERNCRKYYECKRNWRGVIALQVKICQVGRIFSQRLQKCVKGCRCRNSQQSPDRCQYTNAVLPDRFDCSKYYYCNNELEIKTLQCSDQYVFNGEKCELKSEVICDPSKVYGYLSDDDDENCNT